MLLLVNPKFMRRSLSYVVLIYAAALIFSCSKGGKTLGIAQSSQQLIAGQWSLQQQKVVQYLNGIVQLDTTYNTSANNVARIQFNKDGTFYSISFYSTNTNNLSPGAVTTADSTAGVFSFAGTNFNVSAPIAGLGSGGFPVGALTTTVNPAVFTPVSNGISVMQLTSSRLTLHTENIYTLTSNQVTQTFKYECDYYFTR